MKQNIVWLASYPKSGNTWLRAFLSAISNEKIETPDINALRLAPMASSRILFERYTGLDSSDLTPDEIDCLRPDVYWEISNTREELTFLKVHDAFTNTSAGEWMFPPEVTRGVIYLVRNPLDVAVSFARHRAVPISKTINDLCDSRFGLSTESRGLPVQLRQNLLSWSGHVRSWLDSPNRVCLMRYEDMKNEPFKTFKQVVTFLEMDKTDAQIQTAIDQCEFSRLRAQERKNSFHDKPQSCVSFFRKGTVGEWRDCLEPQQVDQLIDSHREIMKKLGYLDEI